MKRSQIWGAAAGAVGAAVTGVAVGLAAHRHSKVAAERRLTVQLTQPPKALAAIPASEPSSVTADDGIRLSCEEIEPRSGRPALTVVLVHGFALDRRTWHFQRPTLAALTDPAVRLVLYDQRSHGRSERSPREGATLDQLGHDLDAVIRALAPDGPLVLVGHSMGGMTIMALAEQNPALFTERVVGVALVSTSAAKVSSAGLPQILLSRYNPVTRGVGLVARLQPTLVATVRKVAGDLVWALTRHYAYGSRDVDASLVNMVDTMISANAVDALSDFAETMTGHDRVAVLPVLRECEVLVAAGDADRVIPATHSDVIADELPGARLVRFPGVGHVPMLEEATVMDEALIGLIRRSVARTRSRRFKRPFGRRA